MGKDSRGAGQLRGGSTGVPPHLSQREQLGIRGQDRMVERRHKVADEVADHSQLWFESLEWIGCWGQVYRTIQMDWREDGVSNGHGKAAENPSGGRVIFPADGA